jgi:flagellar biosynthesis/type III secretory pathway protein FliH
MQISASTVRMESTNLTPNYNDYAGAGLYWDRHVQFSGLKPWHQLDEPTREVVTRIYQEMQNEIDNGREVDFQAGYDEGKEHGEDSGYEDGLAEGLDKGREEGYDEGWNAAIAACYSAVVAYRPGIGG